MEKSRLPILEYILVVENDFESPKTIIQVQQLNYWNIHYLI